jgi:hypothetical protein
MNETRLAALRCAIDIWSVQQDTWHGEHDDILRLAERIEAWLNRSDRLTFTASALRRIPSP